MNRSMNNPAAITQSRLMKQIQSYGFAVNEAVLYLDTHPNDKTALAYYDKYRRLLREAIRGYEARYGALRADHVNTEDGWDWVREPWPWEYDCGTR